MLTFRVSSFTPADFFHDGQTLRNPINLSIRDTDQVDGESSDFVLAAARMPSFMRDTQLAGTVRPWAHSRRESIFSFMTTERGWVFFISFKISSVVNTPCPEKAA